MFICLTDATTGKDIVFKKSLINRVYSKDYVFKDTIQTLTTIDFADDGPSECVTESVYEVYKKLL